VMLEIGFVLVFAGFGPIPQCRSIIEIEKRAGITKIKIQSRTQEEINVILLVIRSRIPVIIDFRDNANRKTDGLTSLICLRENTANKKQGHDAGRDKCMT